jgi:hypothetical protein
MNQKSNFTIEANHLAYGTVKFVVPATDERAAFSAWKQIVSNPRQWIVKRNEANGRSVPAVPTATQPLTGTESPAVEVPQPKAVWGPPSPPTPPASRARGKKTETCFYCDELEEFCTCVDKI